ncbi:MAG: amidohydrolase family protein [Gemmatimonadota bacterium]
MNSPANPAPARPPRIDVHVHLAGVGTQGSGCWISPAFRRRPSFLALRALFGITTRQLRTTVDQDWPALISSLTAASELDYSTVLGFDGVYDAAGKLDRLKSQMIVPQEWVFESCKRYANLLPAPSINPYRRDALEKLDLAIEQGAVMIKWLPVVQAFDPASRRSRPFLERLAETGIPLLVHAGSGEVTFRTIDPSVGHVRDLIPALELGVQVICAHTAAPIIYSREQNQIPVLRDLLRCFPNLWVDNSGLANPSRFPHLPRFADDPLIRERTLHGSDFPVIANAFYYPRRIPLREIVKIERERNRLQREVLIKRAIGFSDDALSRAATILANLDRWTAPTSRLS